MNEYLDSKGRPCLTDREKKLRIERKLLDDEISNGGKKYWLDDNGDYRLFMYELQKDALDEIMMKSMKDEYDKQLKKKEKRDAKEHERWINKQSKKRN